MDLALNWPTLTFFAIVLVTAVMLIAFAVRIFQQRQELERVTARVAEAESAVREAIERLETSPPADAIRVDEPAGVRPLETRLKIENTALKQEIAVLKDQLTAAGVSPEDGNEPNDLKKLLQQLTQDGRDMMVCIQKLERENQQLRDQLGPPPKEAPRTEAGATDGGPEDGVAENAA